VSDGEDDGDVEEDDDVEYDIYYSSPDIKETLQTQDVNLFDDILGQIR